MSWAAVAKTATAPAAPAPAPAPTAEERVAIVDTNAIISGLRLEHLADRFCTVPEVLAEVRDKQSRAFLSTLPFTIDVREPSDESVKAVQRFARETGDIHSLSAVDVKLLALAHTLELAAHGATHLREHPVQVRTREKHKSRPRALPGWGAVTNPEDWKVVDEAPEDMLTNAPGGQSRIAAAVQSLTLDEGPAEGAAAPSFGAAAQAAAATTAPQPPAEDASSGAAAAAQLPSLPPPRPTAQQQADAAQSSQQQQQGEGQAAAGPSGAAAGVDGGAAGMDVGSDGDGDDGDEDDGVWETVSKSRNATRRRQRKQRRRDAWLEQQQQESKEAGAGASAGPGPGSVAAAGTSGQAAQARASPAGAGPPPAGQATAPAASHAHGQQRGSGDEGKEEEGEEDEEDEEGEEDEEDEEGEEGEEGMEDGMELVTDDEAEHMEDDDGVSEAGTTATATTGVTTATETTAAGAAGAGASSLAGGEGELRANTTSRVFSVTADFAMQNVMLQMGLRLVARDGQQITKVSRWALRCSACYFVTKEGGKLFCPRCGNMTMDKVEVTVGPGGAEFFGVRKKFILRGTRYSLPKPKGGRAAVRNPILREDVFLARTGGLRGGKGRKAAPAGEVDPFAPEYGTETWHAANAAGAAGRGRGRGVHVSVGSWKNNPNEVKPQRKSRRK